MEINDGNNRGNSIFSRSRYTRSGGGGGGVEERKSGEAVAILTTAQSLRRNSRKTGYLLDKPKLGPSTTRFLANFTKFQEISALTMPRFESRNVKYCNKLRSPRRDRD